MMELPLKPNWAQRKFEFILRILMAILAAHYIVVNGTNESIFKLLLDPGYIKEMTFSFIVSFLLINWIHFITIRLDEKYGWRNNFIERGILQFLLGVLVPSLMEFFLIAGYFYLLAGISVLETSFMHNEFRTVVVLILFFNLYCATRFLYFELQRTEAILKLYTNKGGSISANLENETNPSLELCPREIFIVNTPLRSFPIRMEDICTFYRAGGYCYLRTYEQSINEAHIIPQMLKDIEEMVDPTKFFRINRQIIISFKSCVSYRQGSGKTLEVILHPPCKDSGDGKEGPFVTVSADRVHAFKAWLDR